MQFVVTPHKLLPFDAFRSFRACLTSNRHQNPDLQFMLGGRRYRAFVAAVEEDDDESFDKGSAELSEKIKWAYRVQDEALQDKDEARCDVRQQFEKDVGRLLHTSAALGDQVCCKRKTGEQRPGQPESETATEPGAAVNDV